MMNVMKNITTDEYVVLYEDFQDRHGYMVKVLDKENNNKLLGYFVRAEVGAYHGKPAVAIGFVPNKDEMNTRFSKAIAIQSCLVGGGRKFIKILKGKTPNDANSLQYPERYSCYVRDYLAAFLNKIKKYYNGIDNYFPVYF